MLHREGTAQAKAKRPEKKCVLRKGATALWVRRAVSEARLRRAVSLLQMSGHHGTCVSFRVTGSLKTEE